MDSSHINNSISDSDSERRARGTVASPEAQAVVQADLLVYNDIFRKVNVIKEIEVNGHRRSLYDADEYLKVYSRVTFVRNRIRRSDENTAFRNRSGKRGPVTEFSDKSRRNMMLQIAKLKEPMEFWQDFTFADDVMIGLSIKQRAKFAAKCINLFQKWMSASGLKLDGIWKKEWEKRKSGLIRGNWVPHYHVLYRVPYADQETYLYLKEKLACAWVKITGTVQVEDALSVARHRKSWRFIRSQKDAAFYMRKDIRYISKDEGFKANESIGRNWGKFGNPFEDEAEIIDLSFNEMVLFKRCLRKLVRSYLRRSKTFKRLLSETHSQFFIFRNRNTIFRVIEWLRSGHRAGEVLF